MRNHPFVLFVLLLFVGLLSSLGCGLETFLPIPTVTQPATETLPPPTASPSPTASPTPVNTPTVPTAAPALVHVSVDALNMRSGPSTLFESLGHVNRGALITLIGVTPSGNDWALVKREDGLTGWVSLTFLEFKGDLSAFPAINMGFTYEIHGQTLDSNGAPADKINLAIYQGNQRSDAYSDQNGEFSFYLPKSAAGLWNLEVVGYDCGSRIAQGDCQFTGHFEPTTLSIDPANPGQTLVFTYKP